jgi:hypothetical protein
MAVTARARLGERFGLPALRNALEAAYTGSGADVPGAATPTELSGLARQMTVSDNPG